ncbi:prenyltransferase [Mobilicoccus sp.]|uniref:prenyltransferase n=1 Tax=Mobilicoccus sp. TaxID=2034349 RepID=UPI0028997C87|nr:prenyltransferase [Mobilicoccus sp.]
MSRLPSESELRRTGATIAATQAACGAIPWDVAGDTAGKVDPWDHVEAAMGLLATGFDDEAAAAYDFLARTQRADGSWPVEWRLGEDGTPWVVDAGFDTNLTGYVAVGIWHHWRTRGEVHAVKAWWPMVRAALDAVVALQLPSGAVAWATGEYGPAAHGLLAGTSCLHLALRCGAVLGDVVGDPRPDWRRAADRIAAVVAVRPDDPRVFDPKPRYSMEWYYPVLGGALRGPAAHDRIEARWEEFVVPGLGIHCVDDHPWVTGAETCELALALTALDRREEAARLVADMQHLRDEDGSYWTGYVYPDDARWPIERSTWTAAAVILATQVLADRAVLVGASNHARMFGNT